MRRAARAGLDVVALTDHDTTAGHAEARQALTGHLTPAALLPVWNSPAAWTAAAGGAGPT